MSGRVFVHTVVGARSLSLSSSLAKHPLWLPAILKVSAHH